MAKFRYQALNADRQFVTGELEADDVRGAIAKLEADGLAIQSIGQCAEDVSLKTHIGRVLQAGPALGPAFDAFAKEMPAGRRRRDLQRLARVLRQGNLAEAEHSFMQLPEYWIPLLSVAVPRHDPGRALSAFLEEWQQADELRRRWWTTFAYPFVVAGMAAAVLIATSVAIIPGFRDIFEEFDLELPGLTRSLLGISDWLNSGGIFVVAAAFLALGAIAFYAKRSASSCGWLGDLFPLPLRRNIALARFSRYTADLLNAGLPLPDALRIAGTTNNRRRIRRAAWKVAHALDVGDDDAFHSQGAPLTESVLNALRAEVPATSRIRLLEAISQSYADRSTARSSWASGIVEPIAIVVIGLVVGIVVLALFLPLVRLIGGLS